MIKLNVVKKINISLLAMFLFSFGSLFAVDLALEKKVEIIAKEIVKLEKRISNNKNGFNEGPVVNDGLHTSSTAHGGIHTGGLFGDLSIGGYGEALFTYYLPELEDGSPSTKDSKIDFRRFVLYFGYKFTPWIKLYAEVEVEHVSEIYLEFAYLDFTIKKYANIALGLLLVPLGLINKEHEFPLYLGTNRPYTERYIIPSTWREIGISFWGEYSIFNYSVSLLNGFNGIDFGLKSNGLRSGRQKGAKALAEDWAVVVDFGSQVFSWLYVGTSHYYGFADQNAEQLNGKNVGVYIGDIHTKLDMRGVSFRFLLAFSSLPSASEIILANLFEDKKSVLGNMLFGSYVEIGYDVLHEFKKISHQLILFSRYETIKIGDSDVSLDSVDDRTILTFGIVYKPIVHIALKLDYEHHLNKENEGQSLVNASMGYVF